MRSRALAVLGLVLALSAVGCRHCRCCGHRHIDDRDRIPPQKGLLNDRPYHPELNEGPPPPPGVLPSVNPTPVPNGKQTGAYGGS